MGSLIEAPERNLDKNFFKTEKKKKKKNGQNRTMKYHNV